MNTASFILLAAGFVGFANAAADQTSYNQTGREWTGVCANGTRQSPIDIPTNTKSNSTNVKNLKKNDNVAFMNTYGSLKNQQPVILPTTVQINQNNGMMMVWGEENNFNVYRMLQFHFHSPSEHTYDGGNHYDLELHVVHQDPKTGLLSVIGINFDLKAGGEAENPFLKAMQAHDTNKPGDEDDLHIPLNKLMSKIDRKKTYYYKGSLTTPGCNEIVNWVWTNDPQPISKAQLASFSKIQAGSTQTTIKNNATGSPTNTNQTRGRGPKLDSHERIVMYGNFRQAQPLYGRTVYFGGDAGALAKSSAAVLMTGLVSAVASLFVF